MAAPGAAYLVYSMAGEAVELDLARETGAFVLTWLNGEGGTPTRPSELVRAGAVVTLTPPSDGPKRPWVAWLARR